MTGAVRVGVLGGTFDPIHFGHLAAARVAQHALALTDVRFIPSHHPPHRSHAPSASGESRLAMIEIAIAGTPGWHASDLELRRQGASYTYDTLSALHAEGLSSSQIFFILGADAFAEIRTWSRYPAVLDAAHFVVIARHGTALERVSQQLPEIASRILRSEGTASSAPESEALATSDRTRIVLIEADTPDISSTEIRERVQAGQDISDLVPREVAAFIAQHGLYRASQGSRSPAAASGR
jgi:nicotinate-nucleotide adenylyltransferase